jgi:hypothetical protein
MTDSTEQMPRRPTGSFCIPSEWMNAYPVASLKTLCRSRNLLVRDGVSKGAIVQLLAAEFLRGSALRKLIDDLPDEDRQLLISLAANGDGPALTQSTMPGVARLAQVGLVVPDSRVDGTPSGFDPAQPSETLRVPDPILFLAHGDDARWLHTPWVGNVAEERIADVRLIEHDLMVMANEIHHSPVRRLKSGYPGKRFLTRVATRLRRECDLSGVKRIEVSGWVMLLYMLLETVGLLRTRHERITTAETVADHFQSDPRARAQTMLSAWLRQCNYNEFYVIPDLVLQREFADYDHGDGKVDDLPGIDKLREAREFVLSLVKDLPPGEWVLIDDIIGLAFLRDDQFLMEPPQSHFYAHAPLYQGVWSSGDPDAGGVWSGGMERAGNWRHVEGRFISEVLTGSLHALGVLDHAETPDGRTLVRLNQLGASLLCDEPDHGMELSKGQSLVVQPNFDIIVFPEGQDVSILWPLLQATEVIARDVTLTLRLTSETMYRASQRGGSADEILDLLELHARTPVPENVVQAIGDWGSRHQRVTVTTRVDLVEAPSDQAFDEFLEEVNDERTLVRRISDTVGVVVGPITRLPAMTELDYIGDLPPCVHLSDDLEVTIVPEREHWSLRAKLEIIAEQTGPETFRITRKSVGRGIASGCLCDELLALLRQASLDELPSRAVFKLQGLFGHLGPAGLGEGVFLQVSRETVLTSMLEISDFRKVILQRLGPTTALIDPDCLMKAHELLESFGIRPDLSFLHEKSLPGKRSENSQHPRVRETPSKAPSTTTRLGQSARRTREIVENAIRKNLRIRLRYRAQTGGKLQERTVDPMEIERRHGVACLSAYCHLRGEMQVFRIPSIVEIEVLGPRQEQRQ